MQRLRLLGSVEHRVGDRAGRIRARERDVRTRGRRLSDQVAREKTVLDGECPHVKRQCRRTIAGTTEIVGKGAVLNGQGIGSPQA